MRGIYDETDYSNIRFVRGRYEEKELNKIYIGNVSRYNLIFKHYMKYRPKRTLGFCCSRMHAEAMAKAFTQRGIKATGFAAMDPTPPRYYHTRLDTPELLVPEALKIGSQVMLEAAFLYDAEGLK